MRSAWCVVREFPCVKYVACCVNSVSIYAYCWDVFPCVVRVEMNWLHVSWCLGPCFFSPKLWKNVYNCSGFCRPEISRFLYRPIIPFPAFLPPIGLLYMFILFNNQIVNKFLRSKTCLVLVILIKAEQESLSRKNDRPYACEEFCFWYHVIKIGTHDI